jgi:2,5-dihydroxypyridine 5,6-dioxygenase
VFELAGSELAELFAQEFDLCAVNSRETVVVLAESASRPEYVAAAFGAARRHGAAVSVVTLPAGSPAPLPSVRTGTGYGLVSLDGNRPVLDLLKASDFVMDLTLEGFIHAPVMGEILGAGTRVLYACEPPEILARNMPTAEDKVEAQAAAQRIREASTMTVTSAAGTHLTADLTNSHPGFQCGFTDDPGRWDHWPSKMALCWPDGDHVNGTLVLEPNDIIFPFKSYVETPVQLTIESGRIVAVAGGREAAMLEGFFVDSADPAARFTSHMGWGLQKTADWWSLGMYDKETVMGMDGRCAEGNFLISTGPHPFKDRHTPYHLDIPMRGCSVSLDGNPVTVGGRLAETAVV